MKWQSDRVWGYICPSLKGTPISRINFINQLGMADEAISQLAFFHENLNMNETFTWDNTQPN